MLSMSKLTSHLYDQVPTTMDAFMCYGPVVPDGYGICYNPHSDYILVCISSFKSSDETDSAFFAATLEGSMLQMKELCLKINQSPSAKLASAELPEECGGRVGQNNNTEVTTNGAVKTKLSRQEKVQSADLN